MDFDFFLRVGGRVRTLTLPKHFCKSSKEYQYSTQSCNNTAILYIGHIDSMDKVCVRVSTVSIGFNLNFLCLAWG